MAVHDDERGTVGGGVKRLERVAETIQIIGITDTQDIPPVTQESRRHIFRESQRRIAFNGDVVVVVNPAQVRKLEMRRKRCRFAGHAFHHATVAAQRIHIVIKHREVGLVEVRGLPARRQRHADARRIALSQRTGRGFHAGSPAIFRMAGAFAVELAEALQIIELHGKFANTLILMVDGLDAGEVEH